MEETMEDVAMKGSKIEKAERKRLKHLEKVKRLLKLDDAWNEESIEAMEIAESVMEFVEGMKDPLVKQVLGSNYKTAVNGLIDSATAIKAAAKMEAVDLLKKV